MDVGLLGWIGIGASLGLSGLGSTIGMGINGPAVIGAWKKCFMQKKPAPFILVVFAGVALSNIIYGFIVMNAMRGSSLADPALLAMGLASGLIIGGVAITQAMCAACAAEAMAETGKGFGNFLMVIGIAETIALFAMVFTLLIAG